MREKYFCALLTISIVYFLYHIIITPTRLFSQPQPINLDSITVWSFNEWIINKSEVDKAAYVHPQFCKRAWYRYSETPYNIFANPILNLQSAPDMLNKKGALLEGGVQCAQIQHEVGWPSDNPFDDDHTWPFKVPDQAFNDFATRNADGDTASLSEYKYPKYNSSIANENWRDFLLYWAYAQIDANVHALEFDEIHGGYRISVNETPGHNPNDGYDDYAIGTANFATRASMLFRKGLVDPITLLMPTASASSQNSNASKAFDDDRSTFWKSDIGTGHWIEIDLKRLRTVQQVYIRLHPQHVLTNFHILYWDETKGWVDFSPAINVSGNIDRVRSFMIEPAQVRKVRLLSNDSEVSISELQLFGEGFRQFLISKYSALGWSPTDSRWQSVMQVDLGDSSQCEDGTMNTFNYRSYLKKHGWSGNPFGTDINSQTIFTPKNPFFFEWLPAQYVHGVYYLIFGDIKMRESLENLHAQSFTYKLQYNIFWKSILDSVKKYSSQQNRKVYITYNGSSFLPHGVDYMLFPRVDFIQPDIPAPSLTDSYKTHLDGTQVRLNQMRMFKERATSYLGGDIPLVAFSDFGSNLPYEHIGGEDEPADERVEYLKIYPMEMYAAGWKYAFPVSQPYYSAAKDKTSKGTAVIDIIKNQTDFLNAHRDIYHNVVVSPLEKEVKVNGIVPYNGEWKFGSRGLHSPANASGVSAAYNDLRDGNKSFLHIINHKWDTTSHRMIPHRDMQMEIPISQNKQLQSINWSSPDTTITNTALQFNINSGKILFTVPLLAYYDVVTLRWETSTDVENPEKNVFKKKFFLSQNYPNPFTDRTTIHFQISPQSEIDNPQSVPTLKVYDLFGREVATLVNGELEVGEHELNFDASNLTNGIYFYRLYFGNNVTTKSFQIVR